MARAVAGGNLTSGIRACMDRPGLRWSEFYQFRIDTAGVLGYLQRTSTAGPAQGRIAQR